MGTVIGAAIGIAVTVVVSRYYYKRSNEKSIGVYLILNNSLFSGIDREIRRQLHFSFQNREVENVQQIEFLVGNDGENAISEVIKPLTLPLPEDVELLDASIIHKNPDSLGAEINRNQIEDWGNSVSFDFTLLNKGDFFVIKLLLSGNVRREDLEFKIVANDLPRSLSFSWLPTSAFEDTKYEMEWGAVGAGSVVLGILSWIVYLFYLAHNYKPSLFPIPWSEYSASLQSFIILLPGIPISILLAIIGIGLIVAAPFGGSLPPRTGPHFPLPEELRRRRFFGPTRVIAETGEDDESSNAE